MKKSDLKAGMRVSVRQGYPIAIVTSDSNGKLIAVMEGGGYHDLYWYNDDLTNKEYHRLDITEVFAPPKNTKDIFNFKRWGIRLWHRPVEDRFVIYKSHDDNLDFYSLINLDGNFTFRIDGAEDIDKAMVKMLDFINLNTKCDIDLEKDFIYVVDTKERKVINSCK